MLNLDDICDGLAEVTSMLDQVQAGINEARAHTEKYGITDKAVIAELDRNQAWIDELREKVTINRFWAKELS